MTTFPQAVLDDLAASRADTTWPTVANTGHDPALITTVHTGTYTTPAGWANTTVTGHQFDKLVVNVANVTFSNCLFRATTGGYMIQLSSGIGRPVFDHCTLDGGDITDQILMAGAGYTMNRCNVYHGADGPRITTNTIFTNNYVHHMTRKGTLHPDCIQITGSRDITITGNRFESWNDTKTAGTTAVDGTRTLDLNNSALQVGDNTGSTTNVVFSGNLMSGGNYCLNMAGGTGKSGVTYSNNTWIAGLYRYGPILRGTGATLQVDGGGNAAYQAPTQPPPPTPPVITRIDLATSDAATLTQGTLDVARIADGTVVATKLDSATQTAVAGAGAAATYAANQTADTGYDLVILAGQSNMSGRGTAYDLTHYDPVDPRILQWGANGTYAAKVSQAVEPLAHADTGIAVSTLGVGPGLPFARWYSMLLPTNRRVLLIPCSFGGTPFEGADSNASGRNWKVASTGSGALYANSIAQTRAALAAAPPHSRVVAVLWLQGEQDASNGTAVATYRTDLDALINAYRSDLGLPNLPFIVGQMTYETRQGTAQANIDGVHQDTPNRLSYTGFAPGPGPGYTDPTNGTLHYSAAGQRINGRSFYDAFLASFSNAAGLPPQPPASVTVAQASATTATVTWVRAGGQITDWTYGYTINGGTTWTTVTHTASTAQTFTITGLTAGTVVQARVAGVNSTGTSSYTLSAAMTMAAVPGQVTGLAAGTPTGSTVPLTWTAVAAATTYKVEYQPSGGAWTTFSTTVTAAAVTVNGLSATTDYLFRVSGTNVVGTGTASATVAATTTGSSYPSGSLLMHIEAASAITAGVADGGAITSLASSDGGAYALTSTGTTSPTLKVTAVNGYPAILFDGTGARLDNGTVTQPAASTEIIVVKLLTAPAAAGAVAVTDSTSTTSKKRILAVQAQGTWQAVGNGGGVSGNIDSGVAYSVSAYQIVGVRFNGTGTSSSIRVNAVQATGATAGTRAGIRLGGSNSGTAYTNYELAEAFFYNVSLTDTDWNSVFAYLGAKYGIIT